MRRLLRLLKGTARSVLTRADAAMNRLYQWRLNPLYHSGALVVVLFLVMLVTGIYLLIFYRIGSPYGSVERITNQVWTGRWMRGLHRYAADAAIVAAFFHALRLFVQGRSWGPRTLAWVSGLILLFVFFVCGWTGYVMVWDGQAQLLAQEGARLLDVLPIFGEPISRTFVGERPLPSAFFFLNLFLHIALPIGVGLLLWIHVSKVARPALMPPRDLGWGVTGLLLALSLVWPISMAEPADLFRLPSDVPLDVFYGFWLPVSLAAPAWSVWLLAGAVSVVLLAAPLWTRPPKEKRPPASVVSERLCTGCEQCYVDCPYEAIRMVPHPLRAGTGMLAALVDPSACVSCGICAGSCAPMGVGPPNRTGRDQLVEVETFIHRWMPGSGDIVLVACDRGAGGVGRFSEFSGCPVFAWACAGSVHTSVIEYLVRAGAGGVLVIACPPRDCWNREGPRWLEERMFHDREAELRQRVDRRRVRLAFAGEGERGAVQREIEAFREELAALGVSRAEDDIQLKTECESDLAEVEA